MLDSISSLLKITTYQIPATTKEYLIPLLICCLILLGPPSFPKHGLLKLYCLSKKFQNLLSLPYLHYECIAFFVTMHSTKYSYAHHLLQR